MTTAALMAFNGFAPAVLLAVLGMMVAELVVSQRNERRYRLLGAVDAPDPVYAAMKFAYPGCFVAMAAEGLWRGHTPDGWVVVGAALFAAGKALKVWAMASLGVRWTYRVLVLRAEPLVAAGPYAHLRHPNYVGVFGELIGMALMMHAVVTGPAATLFFGELLRRRVRAEEQALGLRV